MKWILFQCRRFWEWGNDDSCYNITLIPKNIIMHFFQELIQTHLEVPRITSHHTACTAPFISNYSLLCVPITHYSCLYNSNLLCPFASDQLFIEVSTFPTTLGTCRAGVVSFLSYSVPARMLKALFHSLGFLQCYVKLSGEAAQLIREVCEKFL